MLSGARVITVQHSEKIRLASMATIVVSALIIIIYPMMMAKPYYCPSCIPVYVVAFTLIFTVSLFGEYLSTWCETPAEEKKCRNALNLIAVSLALYELFLFASFDGSKYTLDQLPFSVSHFLSGFLSS